MSYNYVKIAGKKLFKRVYESYNILYVTYSKRYRFLPNHSIFNALFKACFIHGIKRKYRTVKRSSGREKHEINIWGIFETVMSKSDQHTLKTDNKLLKTKTGLARAAIRHFLNSQVLDCYLQGNLEELK